MKKKKTILGVIAAIAVSTVAFFKIAQKSFLALPNGGTPPYTITLQNAPTEIKIGRASCRERV